jgi:hypothetical protein
MFNRYRHGSLARHLTKLGPWLYLSNKEHSPRPQRNHSLSKHNDCLSAGSTGPEQASLSSVSSIHSPMAANPSKTTQRSTQTSHPSREPSPSLLILVQVLAPRSWTLQPEVFDVWHESRHLRRLSQENRRHDSSADGTALPLAELMDECSAELSVEAATEHECVRGVRKESGLAVDLAADAQKLSAELDGLAAEVPRQKDVVAVAHLALGVVGCDGGSAISTL